MTFLKRYGLLIFFIALGVFYYLRYKTAPNLEKQSIAIVNSDGSTMGLVDAIDGPTVVHFYASWCGPCRSEMKIIQANFQSLQKKGLSFVFLTDDSPQQMAPFQEAMPEQIRFYRVPDMKEIGIYSIPTTYFFNAKGEIVHRLIGLFPWEDQQALDEVVLQMNS